MYQAVPLGQDVPTPSLLYVCLALQPCSGGSPVVAQITYQVYEKRLFLGEPLKNMVPDEGFEPPTP